MEPERQAAFDRAIAAGYKHLSQNDPESALASFQLAHDLGRHLALLHMKGHFLLAWAPWHHRDRKRVLQELVAMVIGAITSSLGRIPWRDDLLHKSTC
jgi:hypothetical protein